MNKVTQVHKNIKFVNKVTFSSVEYTIGVLEKGHVLYDAYIVIMFADDGTIEGALRKNGTVASGGDILNGDVDEVKFIISNYLNRMRAEQITNIIDDEAV